MRSIYAGIGTLLLAFMVGCASEPTDAKKDTLASETKGALTAMKAADPSLGAFLDSAYGYTVLPSVGKGGLIVGGAYGRGEVYEQGKLIGHADLTQATIGAQAGGQEFSEIIAFRTKAALDRFTSEKYEPTAQASAIAIKAGAASSTKYDDDVAVFVLPRGGLMAEASIGGQRFNFTPLSNP